MKRLFYTLWLLCIIIIAVYYTNKLNDCSDKGGTFVKSAYGWACIEEKSK